MTRETKIGLLVGLAFIIVVAILLSDPVNNAGEPQAALDNTAQVVRQSVTVPAAANPQAGATAVISPTSPARAPGRDAILTPAEAAQNSPQVQVSVGPGRMPATPIISGSPAIQNSRIAMAPAGMPGHGDAVVTPAHPAQPVSPDLSPSDPRQQAAAAFNEQLVPADRRPTTPGNDASDQADPAVVNAAGKQHYTAQAGDTLSKMAGRLMGANTRANRAAIVAANPSLKKDPNRVIVGEVYVIPGSATVAAAPATASDIDAPSPAPTEVVAPAPEKKPARWYVVKPNDNLWRIATDELGDSGAVAEIVSLNRDILKGSSTLHANMRLRLPPKTVATAE